MPLPSLDDLLGAMSLSKSSFYSEFSSKEALFLACLRNYQQMIISYINQVQSGTSSVRNFLDEIFKEAIDDATSGDPKGCLIVNSAVEFGQHTTQFTEDVRVAMKVVQTAFQSAIQKKARDGEFATNFSPRLLAKAVTTLLSGVRAMIKGGMRAKAVKEVTQKVLDSILT